MKENISKHITYEEATVTKKPFPNEPNDIQLKNMKLLAENVFEKIREHFGIPIYISSFFRSYKVNSAVGGDPNSQHLCLNGAAMDIDMDLVKSPTTNTMIFNYIKSNLDFDQLIDECDKSWIHVSYKEKGNRKQVIKISK